MHNPDETSDSKEFCCRLSFWLALKMKMSEIKRGAVTQLVCKIGMTAV